MQISVENIGKKFVREWIFRHASFKLEAGQKYTFVGPNGSGKSTLLQLLTGLFPASEGVITYTNAQGKEIDMDDWYKHIVIAAPYLELVEEFTLRELIKFHSAFKPFKNDITVTDFEDFIQLSHAKDKLVRHFSSGMKQRVKLGLALMTDVPIIFLDEPTSNLDVQGFQWYIDNVTKHTDGQMLLLGSNVTQEYEFCDNIISVADFKNV